MKSHFIQKRLMHGAVLFVPSFENQNGETATVTAGGAHRKLIEEYLNPQIQDAGMCLQQYGAIIHTTEESI